MKGTARAGDIYLLTNQKGPDPELLVELVKLLNQGDDYGSVWKCRVRNNPRYPHNNYCVAVIIPHNLKPKIRALR